MVEPSDPRETRTMRPTEADDDRVTVGAEALVSSRDVEDVAGRLHFHAVIGCPGVGAFVCGWLADPDHSLEFGADRGRATPRSPLDRHRRS